MISNYLKIAARNIWRHKLYSFINIFGLVLGLSLYVLLHKKHSLEEMNKKIRFSLRKRQIGNPFNSELYLKPLTKIHLHSHVQSESGTNGDIKNIYFFSAVALFVLIIACINFMNLATARSADRAREIGIRKVIGAQRSSIMNQFLGEAILTVILSMFLAVALTELLLPEFNSILNKNLKIDYLNNCSFFIEPAHHHDIGRCSIRNLPCHFSIVIQAGANV